MNNSGQSGYLPSDGRPVVSTEPRTIEVDTDTDAIQEAFNEIPLLLRHRYEINIPDGTYDEHLLVPPFIVEDPAGTDSSGATEGATHNPRITGNLSSPQNVSVYSIQLTGISGAIAPLMEGIHVREITPEGDEPVGVAIWGCNNVSFRRFSFVNSSSIQEWDFLPYSSQVTIRSDTDLGSDDLVRAVVTKHQAQVLMDALPGSTYTNSVIGSVTDYVISCEDGSTASLESIGATAGKSIVDPNTEGFVMLDGSPYFGGPFINGSRIDGKTYLRQTEGWGHGFMTQDSNGNDVIRAVLASTTGQDDSGETTSGDFVLKNGTNLMMEDNGSGMTMPPINLSGETGRRDYEMRMDNGQNTPSGEPNYVYWDPAITEWRLLADPTHTFT